MPYKLQRYVSRQLMKKYSIERIRKFDTVSAYIHVAKHKSDLKYWKPLYLIQLQQWGFGLSGASVMFNWGESGHNWKKLHPDEAEEKASPELVLNWFYSEVEYCSDRMSLDRLFRCHWLYNLYQQKVHKIQWQQEQLKKAFKEGK